MEVGQDTDKFGSLALTACRGDKILVDLAEVVVTAEGCLVLWLDLDKEDHAHCVCDRDSRQRDSNVRSKPAEIELVMGVDDKKVCFAEVVGQESGEWPIHGGFLRIRNSKEIVAGLLYRDWVRVGQQWQTVKCNVKPIAFNFLLILPQC